MPPEYRNRILRLLPANEQEYLRPHLELVSLNVKDVLAEARDSFDYVYFVESGLVSLVNLVSGSLVEVGTVGDEGIAGLSVLLEDGIAPHRTFVQVSGEAWRMPASVAADVSDNCPEFRRLVYRYTQASLIQVAQTASCNLMHTIEQRCARWLLITQDANGTDVFPLTQEFMAFMLGVRRAGVTVAAGELQKSALIRYSRGSVTVLDRPGLEEASCECYCLVRGQFDRLLQAEQLAAAA